METLFQDPLIHCYMRIWRFFAKKLIKKKKIRIWATNDVKWNKGNISGQTGNLSEKVSHSKMKF